MKPLNTSQQLIETYLNLLNTLNHDSKLELIAALSLSMKNERKNNELTQTLFGAFETNRTAEELIEEIKHSRFFNRQIEKLYLVPTLQRGVP